MNDLPGILLTSYSRSPALDLGAGAGRKADTAADPAARPATATSAVRRLLEEAGHLARTHSAPRPDGTIPPVTLTSAEVQAATGGDGTDENAPMVVVQIQGAMGLANASGWPVTLVCARAAGSGVSPALYSAAVVKFCRELASTPCVDAGAAALTSPRRVIILHLVCELSTCSLGGLKVVVEKTTSTCMFVLTSTATRVVAGLGGRVVAIRIPVTPGSGVRRLALIASSDPPEAVVERVERLAKDEHHLARARALMDASSSRDRELVCRPLVRQIAAAMGALFTIHRQ